MFDPINLLAQKNLLASLSNGANIFSSIYEGLHNLSEANFQASQVALQSQTANTIRATEKLDQTFQQSQKKKQLDRVLSAQNAYFASSGIAGASARAIQNADISTYIEDLNHSSKGSQIKDALLSQQNSLDDLQVTRIKEDATYSMFNSLLNGLIRYNSPKVNNGKK